MPYDGDREDADLYAMPLKEKPLIQRIRRAAGQRGKRPAGYGIGDDCAVVKIPHGHEALVTTDFSLEGIHFRREWHPPESIGHRCLARGLSDIAAMGGIPRAAFLSLALPAELPQSWVDRFIRGLLKLAAQYAVPLAGGDTAQSPDGVLADIIMLGSVPAGKAILRSGAQVGDIVYVTGTLGSSAATLQQLRDGEKPGPESHLRHFYPDPRIAIGQFLREKKLASAMIDISDGLSTDLGHICEESKVGAMVYVEAVAGLCEDRAPKRFVSGHPSTSLRAGFFSRAETGSFMIRALAPAVLALAGAKGPHSKSSFPGTTKGRALIRSRKADEGDAIGNNMIELALHGGEEYELLFTARPNRRIPKQIAGVPITKIGEIVRGRQMKLAAANGRSTIFKPAGWEHFAE